MTARRFPFRGVRADRPYPATGLSTARWVAEIRPRRVHFDQLYLTQTQLDVEALFGPTERDSDTHPHVVAWRRDLYLEDGHHRVVRACLTRAAYAMSMRVFTAPEKP